METLLQREGQVDRWNDDRLDDLSRRVDAGFKAAATKEEMNQRFDSVERRIDRVGNRLDQMLWAMLIVGGGFLGNLLTDKF